MTTWDTEHPTSTADEPLVSTSPAGIENDELSVEVVVPPGPEAAPVLVPPVAAPEAATDAGQAERPGAAEKAMKAKAKANAKKAKAKVKRLKVKAKQLKAKAKKAKAKAKKDDKNKSKKKK